MNIKGIIVTGIIAIGIFCYLYPGVTSGTFVRVIDRAMYTLSFRDKISIQRTIRYYEIQEGEKPSGYRDLVKAGLLRQEHVEGLRRRHISFRDVVEGRVGRLDRDELVSSDGIADKIKQSGGERKSDLE